MRGHMETIAYDDIESVASKIEQMAARLRYGGDELDRIAANMRRTGDIFYATEAISEIVNLLVNLDLSVLTTRAMRAVWHGNVRKGEEEPDIDKQNKAI